MSGYWLLALSTPFRGRAIPFHFITYSSRTIGEQVTSRNQEHFRSFAAVRELLGEKPLVLDRESSYQDLLERLVAEQIQFGIRLNLGDHRKKISHLGCRWTTCSLVYQTRQNRYPPQCLLSGGCQSQSDWSLARGSIWASVGYDYPGIQTRFRYLSAAYENRTHFLPLQRFAPSTQIDEQTPGLSRENDHANIHCIRRWPTLWRSYSRYHLRTSPIPLFDLPYYPIFYLNLSFSFVFGQVTIFQDFPNVETRLILGKHPHCDSNAGFYLRRVALYPLSYGGFADAILPQFR